VCGAKSCRREEGYDELHRDLAAVADVVTVRCLDVCAGPVVVVAPASDGPIVLRRMRTRKRRRDLVALVLAGGARPQMTSRLREREVRGRRRRRAIVRLVRAPGRDTTPDAA